MKDESTRTLERQWAMLRTLPRAPRRITAMEVSDRLRDIGFDVTKRTVERDLQSLATRFPLILDDRSKPFGWSWMKDANFEFMPRLTVPQSVALTLAKLHLRTLLPLSMHQDLEPLFAIAEREVSATGWKDWHKRTAVIPATQALLAPKLNPEVLATVQSALARKRCLEGLYRAKGSEKSKTRLIHPLGLLSRGPVLYLICTLFDYQDIVQLAMHRLSEVNELPETLKEPDNFDFIAYSKSEGRRYFSRGSINLVLRFDPPAAEHLKETPLSKDQTWNLSNDGKHVDVTATIEDDETLRWWLLSFADQLEVVKPKNLRTFMAESAHNTSNIYAKKA